MYVCLCRGVTQKQIRREVLAGAVTYDAIQERLEVGLCCGTCSDSAQEVITETLGAGPVCASSIDPGSNDRGSNDQSSGNRSAVVHIDSNVIQMWSPVRNPVRKAG